MRDDPARELLTIREAGTLVRVARRTIYNWMAAGRLDYIRTAGGHVRIYRDSLFRDGPHAEPVIDPVRSA